MEEVRLEKEKLIRQGVPEWRGLVALHSGEVVRCRHLSGDPVARRPWTQTTYTSTGSLDLIYT